MGTETVKAIELVLDWELWPRQSAQKLDSANVRQMRDALRAGITLPPVIANRKDMRLVDGFHRTQAVLDVFGDDADIGVDLRDYGSDSEILLDAGRLNACHGLAMRPKDRAHFILKCRKKKIPIAAIAAALNMDPAKMKDFIAKRSAKTQSGETIPLAYGARNLGGKTLTQQQEHFARTANGSVPEMYVSMLLNALRADAVLLSDSCISRLQELRDEIDRILDEAA